MTGAESPQPPVMVGETRRREKLRPSDLEPDEVRGMVDEPHAVRLGVAYRLFNGMNRNALPIARGERSELPVWGLHSGFFAYIRRYGPAAGPRFCSLEGQRIYLRRAVRRLSQGSNIMQLNSRTNL